MSKTSPMMDRKLTAWQEMEAKGSFLYFILLFSIMVVSLTLLLTASITWEAIVPSLIVFSATVLFAYRIYQRKKRGEQADIYSWLTGIIMVFIPIIAKYNYVVVYGWAIALESYNSSVMLIIAVVSAQFLYRKRLFTVLAVVALVNWVLFLLIAYFSGANMSLQSVVDGKRAEGFVFLREVYIIIIAAIIWFAVYRNMPILEAYERQTTDQRLMIEGQNIRLEQKVEERTRELFEANEKLMELDKLKSNFFANISHEIRTPLTLILSPLESYLQGDYGQEVDPAFFSNLHRNAVRLLQLINNLLDFSKIEAGKMVLNVQKLDITKMMRTYVGMVESACEAKGIAIEFFSTRESLIVWGDFDKIDKICMNLLSNAMKFTERGGKITLSVSDDNDNFRVEIEDTGIGIPKDKVRYVFDRFSQVESGLIVKNTGTGIGLALAKEFAELHGGSISITSRFIEDHPDHHGTLMVLTIPGNRRHYEMIHNVKFFDTREPNDADIDHSAAGIISLIDNGAPDDNVTEPPAVQPDEDATPKNRILVVDDNPDMRNLIGTLLKKKYRVFFAENGEEGIRMARECSPDLIITDVMMPVMNGYDMTRFFKEDEILKPVPIIMITAKSELTHKLEGLEQGADDYITKPFNSKELLTRIRTLLKNYEYQKIIAERNREIENELDIARLILDKLLPHAIPHLPSYRAHALYLPMDKVGGDFYEFSHQEGMINFLLADVSGHGLHAAFLALITKTSFDSSKKSGVPADVLAQINSVVCRSTVRNNFVTAFYAVLDTMTNELRYTNAGHCPPLVYRKKSGDFIELQTRGTALGWLEQMKLENGTIQLMPGDRLILYTDGITECLSLQREFFEVERLKDFCRSNTELHPEDFSRTLLAHLKSFTGSEKFTDDLSLIVFDVL